MLVDQYEYCVISIGRLTVQLGMKSLFQIRDLLVEMGVRSIHGDSAFKRTT